MRKEERVEKLKMDIAGWDEDARDHERLGEKEKQAFCEEAARQTRSMLKQYEELF